MFKLFLKSLNLQFQILHRRIDLRRSERPRDGVHPPRHQAGQHPHRRQRPHQAHGLWALHWVQVDPQLRILSQQKRR